ncbi:MAG: septum site-determining protein MinD [Clostridia bacterium]|nr:septum site-determining protein MinD [Clostridia bacterium]MDD3862966.1 septum site-determining protein MinD [Clostridia bacterium]
MARKIVITSGKGGVGKTTVCANLGVKLANMGFRVVMLDADIGLNNLDVVMGIESKIVFDISDVVSAKCRFKQALIQDDRYPTLYIMPSAQIDCKNSISGPQFKNVVDMLSPSFDYILIDCPAGIECGFHRAVFCANEALIIVTPHISSVRDADKVLSILSSYNLHSKALIVNRVRGDMLLSGEIISVEKIISLLRIPIMGVIPEDDAISTLSSLGAFAYGTSGAKAFSILSENIHNGSKKIYDCTYKYRGIVGLIRRNIKKRV